MASLLHPRYYVVMVTDCGEIPSFFVRIADPIALVTNNCDIFPYYSIAAEQAAQTADLLVLQRQLCTPTRRIVEHAKARGVPIVYETDDNFLDLPKSSLMRMSDEMIDNVQSVLAMADMVTCSTNALADQLASYNPQIMVIENYGLDMPALDTGGRPHLAVVNTDYFKLTAKKAAFFSAVERAVEELEYRVSFFGSVDPAMIDLRGRHPECVNIVDIFVNERASFLKLLAAHGVNVGAVPLDDTDHHLTKSDIKFMDFGSFGVPAAYNNTRVYSNVRDQVDGYIVENSEDGWFHGFLYFADPANRQRCGTAARAIVQTQRGITQYADRMSRAYIELLSRKKERVSPTIDSSRSGLFWHNGDLFVLYEGVKYHVATKPVIAQLIEQGFGFLEPRLEELALLQSKISLTETRQLYGMTPPRHLSTSAPTKPASGRPLKIAWIVPGLIIGGGGHRNIIRCAYHLERLGHQVSLHFIDSHDPGYVVRAQVREHFYEFRGHIGLFDDNFEPCDIAFATHWSTVAHAELMKQRIGEIVYFVQDFEPFFYPMGSEYVLAENTYRKGLYAITSGIWCEHFLRYTYNAEADHFTFPIDHTIYFDHRLYRSNKRIIFFAKPEMPRRCYELGLRALRKFHALRPDVEIAFYGSSHQTSVDFPVMQLGMLPGPSDLAKLYSEATIGLCFSTTNPSLVPYEMMACGLPVVDLARSGNEMNYDGRFDIARLVNPDPTIMAQEIAELISSPDELAARAQRGVEFTRTFPVEEDVGRRIEMLLLERVRKWPANKKGSVPAPA